MKGVALSFACGIAVGFIIYKYWNLQEGRLGHPGSNAKHAVSTGSKSRIPDNLEYDQASISFQQEIDRTTPVAPEVKNTDTSQRWATQQGVMEIASEDKENNQGFQEDTGRWHTVQGVMDVACEKPYSKLAEGKEYQPRFSTREGIMEVAGEPRIEDHAKKIFQDQRKGFKIAESFNRRLSKKHDVIQVAIYNSSNKERQISLWGTDTPVSEPLADDVEDQQQVTVVVVGIHPQGIISNPFNSHVYVANQLSNTVAVCTWEGEIIKRIDLLPTGFPGISSPVNLAAHTLRDKSGFGKVYVACSVSNTINILGTSLEVSGVIAVGIRPVAIAFNPVNELLYVANLADDSISVIDTITEQVILTLPSGNQPFAIVVNPLNGDVFIACRLSNSITVYSQHNIYTTTINGLNNPISLFWHPVLQKIYVTLESENQIACIDPESYAIMAPIAIGHRHRAMAYHPGNGFLYIASKDDGTITILDWQNVVRAVIPVPGFNVGFGIHPDTFNLLWTGTATGSFKLSSMLAESSFVLTDRNAVKEQLNEFRSNPPQISHVKIIISGNKSIPGLIVRRFTISGKQNDTPISLSSYESPQHFLRVYQVDAFKKTTIDGLTQWLFALPPLTTVTFLIYYKPFKNINEEFIKQSFESVTT